MPKTRLAYQNCVEKNTCSVYEQCKEINCKAQYTASSKLIQKSHEGERLRGYVLLNMNLAY